MKVKLLFFKTAFIQFSLVVLELCYGQESWDRQTGFKKNIQ